MTLFDREYSLDFLLSKDNGYKTFPIDKETNMENQLYLSKDFNSITIFFDDSDKDYSGYTISATSTE